MVALGLCQGHYQILLITYLKDFIVIRTLTVSLHYVSVKYDQLIFRCFECKKNYKKEYNKELIKIFNEDINKYILLIRKGVYPYEYMDRWEKFEETSLPDKEGVYSSLNKEDIIDVNHRHAKIVFKKLSNKDISDFHDLYVQRDTLLLVDVFEDFKNKCIKIYELDPAHFLSALDYHGELV